MAITATTLLISFSNRLKYYLTADTDPAFSFTSISRATLLAACVDGNLKDALTAADTDAKFDALMFASGLPQSAVDGLVSVRITPAGTSSINGGIWGAQPSTSNLQVFVSPTIGDADCWLEIEYLHPLIR